MSSVYERRRYRRRGITVDEILGGPVEGGSYEVSCSVRGLTTRRIRVTVLDVTVGPLGSLHR